MANGAGSAMVAQRIVIPLVASSSLVLHPITGVANVVIAADWKSVEIGSIPVASTIFKHTSSKGYSKDNYLQWSPSMLKYGNVA